MGIIIIRPIKTMKRDKFLTTLHLYDNIYKTIRQMKRYSTPAKLILMASLCAGTTPTMLFDFTKMSDLDQWVEQSDTVRTVGMSKAVFSLQKTQIYQRAIFFALLNAQPNGAGFAGIRRMGFSADLSGYDGLEMFCRAQGEFNGFKIVLRHRGLNDEPHPTYEQMFTGPSSGFSAVKLPFSEFKPYYRGRLVNDTDPLDVSRLTGFGIQFYGGVYLPVKQKGPATLEIDWIKAY